MSSAPQASRSRKRKQPKDNASAPRKRRQTTASSLPPSPPSSSPPQPSWKTDHTIALMNLAYWITRGARPPKPPGPRRAAFLDGFTRTQLRSGFAHAYYLRRAAVDYNNRLQRQLDEVLLNPVPMLPTERAQTVSSRAGSVHENVSEAGEEQGNQERGVKEGRDEEAARDATDQADGPQDGPQSEPHNSPQTLLQNADAVRGQAGAPQEGPRSASSATSERLVLNPRPTSVPASTRASSAPAIAATAAVAPAATTRLANSDSPSPQTPPRPSSHPTNAAAQQMKGPLGAPVSASLSPLRLPSPSVPGIAVAAAAAAATMHGANDNPSPQVSPYPSRRSSPQPTATVTQRAAQSLILAGSSPELRAEPGAEPSPQPNLSLASRPSPEASEISLTAGPVALQTPPPLPSRWTHPWRADQLAQEEAENAARFAKYEQPYTAAFQLGYEEGAAAAYADGYEEGYASGYGEGRVEGHGEGYNEGLEVGYDAGNRNGDHGDGWEELARCAGDAEHEADVRARLAGHLAERWNLEKVEMLRWVVERGVEELKGMLLGACLERDGWVERNAELEGRIARERERRIGGRLVARLEDERADEL